jgi:hypothetical protein
MQLSIERDPYADVGYSGSGKYDTHTDTPHMVHESILEQAKFVYPLPHNSHANIKRCLKRRIRQRSLPLKILTAHRKILIQKISG